MDDTGTSFKITLFGPNTAGVINSLIRINSSAEDSVKEVSVSAIGEILTPYLWSDVWHSEEDSFAGEIGESSNPGIKFARSREVMTITHTGYPVYSLERVRNETNTTGVIDPDFVIDPVSESALPALQKQLLKQESSHGQ